MPNFFAAGGRINYTRNTRLYLLGMDELPEKSHWLYKCFREKGNHGFKRNERYQLVSGRTLELLMKQVLIRSIKSHGNLSGGRGWSQNVIIMCRCKNRMGRQPLLPHHFQEAYFFYLFTSFIYSFLTQCVYVQQAFNN